MSDDDQGRPGAGEPQLPAELLRALRAPGTPEELAGEADVLAAFRAAQPAAPGRLRLVGRLGAGGLAAVATVVLGTGVAAAAYTNNLPEPVQQLAHRVLAPIGVPAAAPRHRPTSSLTAAPPVSSSPSTPRPTPARTSPSTSSRAPSRQASSPGSTPTAASAPTASPSSAPTGAPSATASPSSPPIGTASPTTQPSSPPRPLPASVSLTLSATRVAAGSTVSASGTAVDATGKPVARQRVALQASTGTGWTTVAVALTDRLGSVSLSSPAITQNIRLRLKLTSSALPRPLLSLPARVAETPDLIVTFAGGDLHVLAVGAQPGDTLLIGLLQDGTFVQVGTANLTGAVATYQVAQTTTKQRYVVALPRTPQHLGAKGAVTVPSSGR